MYQEKYHQQDISRSSFLVTGGAGFIGSNIVEYLINHGAGKVRVLDNFSTGSVHNVEQFLSHPAFELVEGDIRDFDTCSSALQGIDYVSHQAALGSVPRSVHDPLTSNSVNVSGFLNMLVAARDAGVKKMVYAASSSTYGDHKELPKVEDQIGQPLSPYAVTKYVNELYAGVFSRTYGFHTIGLRYFNVFGPRQNPKGPYAAVIPLFVQAALTQTAPVIYGDGETSRDFTHVENAVQANIKALFSDVPVHEVLNIACGERTSLNQLWHMISQQAAVHTSPVYKPERVGDVKHSLADIGKAIRLIGYNPKISVQQGLASTVRWYRTALPHASETLIH